MYIVLNPYINNNYEKKKPKMSHIPCIHFSKTRLGFCDAHFCLCFAFINFRFRLCARMTTLYTATRCMWYVFCINFTIRSVQVIVDVISIVTHKSNDTNICIHRCELAEAKTDFIRYIVGYLSVKFVTWYCMFDEREKNHRQLE